LNWRKEPEQAKINGMTGRQPGALTEDDEKIGCHNRRGMKGVY
jgi:hypothetical protein